MRPAIVTAAVKYPFRGWVGDSNVGYHAFLVAFMRGVITYLDTNPDGRLQLVPVDICGDLIIHEAFGLLNAAKGLTTASTPAPTNVKPVQSSVMAAQVDVPETGKVPCVVRHAAIPPKWLFSGADIASESYRITGTIFRFRDSNLCDAAKLQGLRFGAQVLSLWFKMRGDEAKSDSYRHIYYRMMKMRET